MVSCAHRIAFAAMIFCDKARCNASHCIAVALELQQLAWQHAHVGVHSQADALQETCCRNTVKHLHTALVAATRLCTASGTRVCQGATSSTIWRSCNRVLQSGPAIAFKSAYTGETKYVASFRLERKSAGTTRLLRNPISACSCHAAQRLFSY